MTKGNGRLLYGVNNRGNLVMLRNLNDAMGSNDPQTIEHFGNGFLMRQGYTLLWSGWNWDVIESNHHLLQFMVPCAMENGHSIVQKTIAEIVNSNSIEAINNLPLAWGNSRCYPSSNFPDNSMDILTVRDRPDGDRREIGNDCWKYCSDSVSIQLDGGFKPGKIYELIYTARNPRIVGLGLAAVRDILSFFKYEKRDKRGNDNLLLTKVDGEERPAITKNYIIGISQSGRFITQMIWQGFHVDEEGRMIIDGARIHVAGGGKGEFNFRFAQTTHHPSDLEGNYMPADHPPFNYLSDEDPGSGGENDLLAAAKRMNLIPRIIITNHALEYWTRSASLIHTTLDGKKDATVHENVRIFMLNGAPHGTPWSRASQVAEHSLSTLDISPILRSTLLMLDEWVSNETLPPESRYPTFQDGTLITAIEHKKQMPEIPGMRHPGRNLHPPVCDYGPDFWSEGKMTEIPPLVLAYYPTFVPAVDGDGNGKGGIRLPDVSVPLGTYQGFNPRNANAGSPNYLTRFYGSFWPFTKSTEERMENGDPRHSLNERYSDQEDYLEKVIRETNLLLINKFLIAEDADRIISSARENKWPPVSLETSPFWE